MVKSIGKRPLGRSRRTRAENIRMDIKEVLRRVGLIQLRIGNVVRKECGIPLFVLFAQSHKEVLDSDGQRM